MKKYILLMLILLLLFLAGCSAKNNGSGPWEQATAAINVAQGGEVVVLGDTFYYIDNNRSIRQSNFDFSQTRTVLSDQYIRLLCSDGRRTLYFAVSITSGGYDICSYDLETSKRSTLLHISALPRLLSCNRDHLYYILGDTLYTFDLKTGSEFMVIDRGVETFTCTQDSIYYATKEGNGNIYRMASPTAEPEFVCSLPFTFYSDLAIDQMFIAEDTLYIRKCWMLSDYRVVYTSTSYQIRLSDNAEEITCSSTTDMHGQFPVPDGSGNYFIFSLHSEADKHRFQNFFSSQESASAYIASYTAGKLGYSPANSDWIEEIPNDYIYYSAAYFSPRGLILEASYRDRYVFHSFDQ